MLETLGRHRALGSVDPSNRASSRLMERVNLRREAHFRESLRFKGEWVDGVIHAMLRREWEQRRIERRSCPESEADRRGEAGLTPTSTRPAWSSMLLWCPTARRCGVDAEG
jgi:hypothetical protein